MTHDHHLLCPLTQSKNENAFKRHFSRAIVPTTHVHHTLAPAGLWRRRACSTPAGLASLLPPAKWPGAPAAGAVYDVYDAVVCCTRLRRGRRRFIDRHVGGSKVKIRRRFNDLCCLLLVDAQLLERPLQLVLEEAILRPQSCHLMSIEASVRGRDNLFVSEPTRRRDKIRQSTHQSATHLVVGLGRGAENAAAPLHRPHGTASR